MRLRIACLLLCGLAARADTHTAASTSRADVGAAYALCVAGDTLAIPAGDSLWTNKLTITNAITIQGSGATATVIRDDIPDANEDTLTDSALLEISLVASGTTRVTGIHFADGNVNAVNYNGVITVAGGTGGSTNGARIVMDHCHFDRLQGAFVFTSDALGVISANTFTFSAARIGVYIYHQNWNGASNSDGSWADTNYFGTDKFLFIESNLFTNESGIYAITDAYRGSRYVVRSNVIYGGWVELHGTDSGGRLRGARAVEVYNNIFHDLSQEVVNMRSGVGIIYSNTVVGYIATPEFKLDAYRRFYPFALWGMALGTNDWDVNLAGGPFDSGNANTGSTTYTLVDTDKTWDVNQWSGYSVIGGAAAPTPEGGYVGSYIYSNSANTIYVSGNGSYSANQLTFNNGDAYTIWKVTEALDQPGRSGGTQLSGENPTPANDQGDDPCYEWQNYYGTALNNATNNLNFASGVAFIRENEHFYNDTVAPNYTAYAFPHPLLAQGGGVASPGAPIQGLQLQELDWR